MTNFTKAAMNCPVDSSDQYNSFVKIIRKVPGDEFYCTGTIIKNCYVLTAAHCLTMGSKDKTSVGSPSEFSIRGGVNSEILLPPVQKVIAHPQYNSDKERFDIGLIQLSKCDNSGLEIDYSALSTEREVIVGGYGATRLRGWEFQPTRHVGKNIISRFDKNEICIGNGKTLILEDGKTVKNDSDCLPTGQDSGSALLMNKKIRAVFKSGSEKWNKDGSTLIKENCYVNLKNPIIQNFIEEHINSTEPSTAGAEKVEIKSLGTHQ